MVVRVVAAALGVFLVSACSGSPHNREAKAILDKEFASLCDAFEEAGRYALKYHLHRDIGDFPEIRQRTALRLAQTWELPAPRTGVDDCSDLKELAQSKAADSRAPVAEKELYAQALDAFVWHLDPHSVYLWDRKEKSYRDREQNLDLGIGVGFRRRIADNWIPVSALVVEDVVSGSPAWNILHPGDRIVGVNGAGIEGRSFNDAVSLIRGSPSDVRLAVDGRNPEISLKKARYRWSPVLAEAVRRPGVVAGYVKLREFSEGSSLALENTIRRLEAEGVQAFVLDLRGDPGGLLDEAVQISGLFRGGRRVVALRGAPGKKYPRAIDPNRDYYTPNRQRVTGKPLVVLINQESASAAELLAGDLWLGAGIVVGDRSFGKGTGQMQLPISERSGLGGLLILTSFRYELSDGFALQLVGVQPHLVVHDPLLQEVLENRRIRGLPTPLVEGDYEAERLIPATPNPAVRFMASGLADLARTISDQSRRGEYDSVCLKTDDCQREMAYAFARTWIQRNRATASALDFGG